MYDRRMSDNLQNYESLKDIGRGGASIVYSAVCKSGRLRGRKVALKKIPQTPSFKTTCLAPSSTSIHQSLHHPSIVSLFSTFSVKLDRYHVIELCPRGTLSQYFCSRGSLISEDEIRGMMKSLVGALIYLRQELILHQDIKSSNVLITDDNRVKLSGFDLAIRLPSLHSTISTFSGFQCNIPPEVVSHIPYSFPVDVWSLGCLMITCLSGVTSLEINNAPQFSENVSQVLFDLPSQVSPEAKSLVFELLEISPKNRIIPGNIISHAFFDANRGVCRLRPLIQTQPNAGSATSGSESTGQTSPAVGSKSTSQKTYEVDILDDRRLLAKEMYLRPAAAHNFNPARRIVSDPLPRKGFLISRAAPIVSSSTMPSPKAKIFPLAAAMRRRSFSELRNREVSDKQMPRSQPEPIPLSPHENSATFGNSDFADLKYPLKVTSIIARGSSSRLNHGLSSPGKPGTRNKPSDSSDMVSTPQPNLPVGTTRPTGFNTSSMSPHTQKLAHGMVSILSSRSLLVDLREGERRKGRRGEEVLVIDPDGQRVQIFSAPHLSTPCCLTEPVAVYSVECLPTLYWKQYNDAGRVVDQIKQKTPKLVMYTMHAKCTLMSNGPEADVEILYSSFAPFHQEQRRRQKNSNKPSIRIRFCRKQTFIEISKFISTEGVHLPGNGEWTKKRFTVPGEKTVLRGADWGKLDDAEKNAFADLDEFMRVCCATEKLMDGDVWSDKTLRQETTSGSMDLPTKANPPGASLDLEFTSPPLRSHDTNLQQQIQPSLATESSLAGSRAVNFMSQMKVAARPTKLLPHFSKHTTNVQIIQPHSTRSFTPPIEVELNTQPDFTESTGVSDKPQWSYKDIYDEEYVKVHAQTRFIPSIGWCIRHGCKTSQGGRYRIMFFDGVVMEVDVDEEWVEFTDQNGSITRNKIKDCSSQRKVGERMKFFQEFVSMFDDEPPVN